MTRFLHLLGKPWAVPDNPPETYDCWSLVVAARKAYGLDTPAYSDGRTVFEGSVDDPPSGWHQLSEPRANCVAVMGKERLHVGVVVYPDSIIHSPMNSYVRVDKLRLLERFVGQIGYWELDDATN